MLARYGIGLVFVVLLCSGIRSGVLGDNQARKPNVLFIAVDDLRPELGCYATRAKTPTIDRLAKSGVQFTRAYCNQAVCGASRVSLMTGLYPEFTGERTFHVTDWRKRWSTVTTMNQHFKNNGYDTIGLGKIYHGSNGPGVDPENWSRWITVAGKQYADPENSKNRRSRNGKNRGPSVEAADVADDTYADGNRAKVGAAQIMRLAKKEKPFFLAVGFTKPHLPFIAPKKYWDLYDRDDFVMPANSGVPPGYPDYARNKNAGELRAYSDIPVQGLPSTFPESLNKKLLHGYHACVSYLDRNVGVLLEALKESGVDENTIIIFWADHGWKLGDHSSWCKHTNFECDNRVPLIVRLPAPRSKAQKCHQLVELIDIYPTLCELCQLERPTHLQGKSFAASLFNPDVLHRESAYSSYAHGRGKKLKNVVGHSIRSKNHRYTEWWEKGTDRVVDTMLTDIEQDPGETTAINDQPQLRLALSQQLAKRVKSARSDPFRVQQTSFLLRSKVLGEQRRINVMIPDTKQNPDELPVLYMPDGGLQEDFLHISATIRELVAEQTIAPTILVGIENTDRKRDLTGPTKVARDKEWLPSNGGSASFRSFIRDELIPEVNRRFPNNGDRAIVGESLAGLFVVETMLREPTLFDRYIAMDPSLWWNDHELVKNIKEKALELPKSVKRFWFAASGTSDIYPHTKSISEALEDMEFENLKWKYVSRPDEKHSTIFRATKRGAFTWALWKTDR